MSVSDKLTLRPVNSGDRHQIANLIHFEAHVHRHLDWCPPLEWIGKDPFIVAEMNNQVMGVLSCPPDPDCVAWVRLFAAALPISLESAWDALWSEASAHLKDHATVKWAAVIPLHPWFHDILSKSGFEAVQQVVLLEWEGGDELSRFNPDVLVRPMVLDDLKLIYQIDVSSFVPLWRNSIQTLEQAYRQAVVATVAELDEQPIGYQISTATAMGGHLARLAVLPEHQSCGIGFSLVGDMLAHFSRRGTQRVTVNTQQDNYASLALYQKAGFRETGEKYPVYRYSFE